MAFVRKRGGSHQLIKTYRDNDGSVRQRVLVNLGQYRSLEEAVAAEPERFKDALKPRQRATTDDVVSGPKDDPKAIAKAAFERERRARMDFLDSLAPMVLELDVLINTQKKRDAIAETFKNGFWEEELPDRITQRDFVKSSRRLLEWLGEFLAEAQLLPGGPRQSRAMQWQGYVSEAVAALQGLKEMQESYESWRDSIPEALQTGATFDKLEEVIEVDVNSAIDAVQELANADLPVGFGKD